MKRAAAVKSADVNIFTAPAAAAAVAGAFWINNARPEHWQKKMVSPPMVGCIYLTVLLANYCVGVKKVTMAIVRRRVGFRCRFIYQADAVTDQYWNGFGEQLHQFWCLFFGGTHQGPLCLCSGKLCLAFKICGGILIAGTHFDKRARGAHLFGKGVTWIVKIGLGTKHRAYQFTTTALTLNLVPEIQAEVGFSSAMKISDIKVKIYENGTSLMLLIPWIFIVFCRKFWKNIKHFFYSSWMLWKVAIFIKKHDSKQVEKL
jgi:hypothetical protein